MKSSQPPALATWLLEHLVAEGKNEVLAGDLLEEFGRQGSTARYWRQVLAAIMVSFLQELRVRWTAILVAIVCSSAVPWQHLWFSRQFQSLFQFGIRLPWPLSLISQIVFLTLFNAAMLVIVLSMYLAVTRNSNPRRFSQALLVALPVLALGNTSLIFGSTLHQHFFVRVLEHLPLFFGLLISMWIAVPSAAGVKSKRIPA